MNVRFKLSGLTKVETFLCNLPPWSFFPFFMGLRFFVAICFPLC